MVKHPLAQRELTILRDKSTGGIAFRKGLVRLGRYLGYEIIGDMGTKDKEVETPLRVARGIEIPDLEHVVVINVLRAAIPLVEGLIKSFPSARVGIISAYREGPPDFKIRVDYVRLPSIKKEDTVIIADPMLATGHTMGRILEEVLNSSRPKRVIAATVVCYELAVRSIQRKYPPINIYTVAMDPELDENGYILPGLGDAGDRAFGEATSGSSMAD